MSERLDFYRKEAEACFSDIPWLKKMQKEALSEFTRLGFPTRHDEDWKYTSVDSFLKESFVNKEMSKRKIAETPLENTIPIINGQVDKKILEYVPADVIIQPLSQALVEHPDKIRPYLNHMLQSQHGFHALNTALLAQGLFIYLPAHVVLAKPLYIAYSQDRAHQASYLRHLIVLETGSSASIIEDYQGEEACYFTNTITEVSLAAQAKLSHYKIQRESLRAYHMGHIAVKQAEQSEFHSHSFSIGGQWVRSDTAIDLAEPKARCLMNGVYVPSDTQHMDHHTVVFHSAPACHSEQDYRGILKDEAHAVFNGRVIVAKHAQKTEAKQQNKNLLLSKNTEIDTKPQLEIFADDVICTHGATVGQLDEEALFYLATRGIGREEATRYLVQAFTQENIRRLTNTKLAAWIETLI